MVGDNVGEARCEPLEQPLAISRIEFPPYHQAPCHVALNARPPSKLRPVRAVDRNCKGVCRVGWAKGQDRAHPSSLWRSLASLELAREMNGLREGRIIDCARDKIRADQQRRRALQAHHRGLSAGPVQ